MKLKMWGPLAFSKNQRILFLLLLMWVWSGSAWAQTLEAEEKFFILPLAGYSTQFGVGGGASMAWLNMGGSSWQATLAAYYGSLYSIGVGSADFLNRDLFGFLYVDLGGTYYQNYRGLFFGLGNDTDQANQTQFAIRRNYAYFKLGIRPFENFVIGAGVSQGTTGIDRGGDPTLPQFLDQYGTMPNASGLTNTMTQAFVTYDSRKPYTAPQEGNLASFVIEQSQPFGNETLAAQHVEFIGENYLEIVEKEFIFVTHLKYERIWGDGVPFFLQAPIGGLDTLRGFYISRFIDNGSTTFNFEPRWSFWTPDGEFFQRFELSAAFEMGRVFNNGSVAPAPDYHTDEDFGLTVVIHPNIPIRFDYAISDESTLVYLNLFYPF